jgi:hypothetical protein
LAPTASTKDPGRPPTIFRGTTTPARSVNATWSASGKFGSALSFNGTNSIVTIPDSSSLDLTAGMTLEAWVNPSALGSNTWRDRGLQVAAEQLRLRPVREHRQRSSERERRHRRQRPRPARDECASAEHLEPSGCHLRRFDLRLYVNGTQVGSQAATGAISTSTGAVTIGGQQRLAEWFSA